VKVYWRFGFVVALMLNSDPLARFNPVKLRTKSAEVPTVTTVPEQVFVVAFQVPLLHRSNVVSGGLPLPPVCACVTDTSKPFTVNDPVFRNTKKLYAVPLFTAQVIVYGLLVGVWFAARAWTAHNPEVTDMFEVRFVRTSAIAGVALNINDNAIRVTRTFSNFLSKD
jgi:hypothetical protein